MYIYILESELFPNQTRKVVLNFPAKNSEVERLANIDNQYPADKGWRVMSVSW